VLNPRRESALALPDLPDASPVNIATIAAAPTNVSAPGLSPGGPGAPAKGSETKKKGPMTVASMLERTLEADSDKDGKLSMAEIAGVNERMRPRLEGADKNGDGFIDKDELMPIMAASVQRMKEMQAQQGGGGGIPGTGGGQ
jgi:hypothetical protein